MCPKLPCFTVASKFQEKKCVPFALLFVGFIKPIDNLDETQRVIILKYDFIQNDFN